ncbi:MAG: metalloregulator ArsR/SmtB family transcription factor, partial [Bacteroidota bacterium]
FYLYLREMNVISLRTDAEKLKRVARLMKTVSHPVRLSIIDLLLEKGAMSVTDIYENVGISQSNASQHLKALEDVGVLGSDRNGKSILYQIQNQQIAQLLHCVNECTTC